MVCACCSICRSFTSSCPCSVSMVACKTQTKSETSWFSVCDLVCVWFSISVCDFSEKACFIKASWCSSIANWFPFFANLIANRGSRFAYLLLSLIPLSRRLSAGLFSCPHTPRTIAGWCVRLLCYVLFQIFIKLKRKFPKADDFFKK